jgi:hypothetical protein
MLVNFDEVVRAHRHFLAQNERAIEQSLTIAGRHGVDHVQKYPKFQRRTGKLQDKTQASRVIRTSGGKLIRLMNPLRYAAAIDTGSKPHDIKPRRRKFLRFTVRGKLVFARKVRHPGTKPYKFLWRATHSAHRVMGDYLRREMTSIAKRF